MSSFDPSSRLLSSSGLRPEVGSCEKRGRRRFSSRIDAAGSVAVKVRERKRGLSTIRAVVRAGRKIDAELVSLNRWWAAHWTKRRVLSTRGTMLCLRREAKVRVCNSDKVGGGGVAGGECCALSACGEVGMLKVPLYCGLLLLTKASAVTSNVKPRFSRARMTCPFERSGTRM